MAGALLFSVDVEPDDPLWRGLGDRASGHGESLSNIQWLKKLSPLMRRTGLKPTLLATHSAACSDGFSRVTDELGAIGEIEVGMHLHPADRTLEGWQAALPHDNLMQVDGEILQAQLGQSHLSLQRRFGSPLTFRGAAWTVDGRILRWLSDQGYLADTSVTPGVDWTLRSRPDWSQAPTRPYRIHLDHPQKEDGASPLLELPPSIWVPRPVSSWAGHIPKARSLLTQPLLANRSWWMNMLRAARPASPRWLRPALENEAGLQWVAEALADRPCLHIMIHSNELAPGASPYSRTAEEAQAVFSRLCHLVEELISRGWRPMTMASFSRRSLSPIPA